MRFYLMAVMLFVTSCSRLLGGKESDDRADVGVVGGPLVEVSESVDAQPDLVEAPTDAAAQEAPQEQLDTLDVEPEAAPPPNVAQRFLEAGGQQLCEAWYYALSPELRSDGCARTADAERRERCERKYAPVRREVSSFCKTALEESLRWTYDPGMVVSVVEKESSGGRLRYDREAGVYRINADICHLWLSNERVVERRGPGRKAGTTRVRWSWGENGYEERDVFVEEEDEDGILINTCTAGEHGRFQLLPSNFGHGRVVQATGERLTGTAEERAERVLRDVVLDTQLGCQELAMHRDVCPESRRGDWWLWVGAYNTGRCDDSVRYARNVAALYLRACDQGYVEVEGQPLPPRIADLWPECERVREWHRRSAEMD